MSDRDYLLRAIELSQASVDAGGYPVGAVIVIDGKVVSEGISNGKALKDATSHAEVAAIRAASQKLGM